jgi:hypothetical protein
MVRSGLHSRLAHAALVALTLPGLCCSKRITHLVAPSKGNLGAMVQRDSAAVRVTSLTLMVASVLLQSGYFAVTLRPARSSMANAG